jgi:hypothetical protein
VLGERREREQGGERKWRGERGERRIARKKKRTGSAT